MEDNFDVEGASIDVNDKMDWSSSFVTKMVRYVFSFAVLSLVVIAGVQYSYKIRTQSPTDIPIVGYPNREQRLLQNQDPSLGTEATSSSYSSQPGAADLVQTINMYRSGLSPLAFSISSVKSNTGKLNPLMTAASKRNYAWGSAANTPSIADFVSTSTIGGSTTTASAISSAFSAVGISAPSSYKEYAYYGEYCSTHLFLIMKNGPSSTSDPGYGIQNELLSKTWTNIAISVGQNPVDMSASGTNGLGNAYWTILFSTSFNWSPASKRPSRKPTAKPI